MKDPIDNENDKNLNFVQIDRRVMAAHRQLMSESPVGAVVLSLIAEYMDKSNALVISYATLQDMTGYSRASIGNAIKKLKADRWIQAVKIGTANVYFVNSAAFWTANRKGKYYSQFHATVVASASEQATTIKKLNSLQLKQLPMTRADERLILGNEDIPPPDQSDMELD